MKVFVVASTWHHGTIMEPRTSFEVLGVYRRKADAEEYAEEIRRDIQGREGWTSITVTERELRGHVPEIRPHKGE
jgi:hypothetical protein